MLKSENKSGASDKKLAAVCGLYCEACTIFIATREDPARLKALAALFQLSEEDLKCGGCRSDQRTPYCQQCKMFACAAKRGLDFCVECPDYPCSELKQFQAEAPHRLELWEDLARIKAVGYQPWLDEVKEKTYESDCIHRIRTARCSSAPRGRKTYAQGQ